VPLICGAALAGVEGVLGGVTPGVEGVETEPEEAAGGVLEAGVEGCELEGVEADAFDEGCSSAAGATVEPEEFVVESLLPPPPQAARPASRLTSSAERAEPTINLSMFISRTEVSKTRSRGEEGRRVLPVIESS